MRPTLRAEHTQGDRILWSAYGPRAGKGRHLARRRRKLTPEGYRGTAGSYPSHRSEF